MNICVCMNSCTNGGHQFCNKLSYVLQSYLPPPISNEWFLIAYNRIHDGGIYAISWISGRTVIKLVGTQLSVTVSTQNIQCYWIRSCGLHSVRTGVKGQLGTTQSMLHWIQYCRPLQLSWWQKTASHISLHLTDVTDLTPNYSTLLSWQCIRSLWSDLWLSSHCVWPQIGFSCYCLSQVNSSQDFIYFPEEYNISHYINSYV